MHSRNFMRCISNTGCSIFSSGFKQQIAFFQFWQLLNHKIFVSIVGYHKNIFGDNRLFETLECLL